METKPQYVTATVTPPMNALEVGGAVLNVLVYNRTGHATATAAEIAKELNISWFDVGLAIKSLEAVGYPIEKTRDEPHRYYLITPIDRAQFDGDLAAIRAHRTARYLSQWKLAERGLD